MVLHLFIDTSILSGTPKRDGAAFRTLERLCKKGDIVCHLSSVTVREFSTQQTEHLKSTVATLRKGLRDLERRGIGHASHGAVKALWDAVTQVEQELAPSIDATFAAWVSQTNVIIHEPDARHLSSVFNGYFDGSPPFAKPKNRNDFPDAFIFQALRDVRSTASAVYAVAADQRLRTAFDDLPGVEAYESLDEFLKTDPVQSLIHSANAEHNLQLVRHFLGDYASQFDSIVRRELVGALADQTVRSHYILDDDHRATIVMVDDAYDIEYKNDEVDYYGEGLLRLPFEAAVEVLASYTIFKGDFLSLEPDRAKAVSISECNDHYFEAEESLTIKVAGSLTLQFEPKTLEASVLDKGAVSTSFRGVDASLDEVEVVEVVEPQRVPLPARHR
jgi:hypothetical protein